MKQDLKELRKSVHKCETLCKTETGKELSNSETFSEPSTIPKGFNNHDQMPSRRSQPVPRILPPDSYPVSAVAFYSYLSKATAPNLPAHHLMVYDVVHINRGNGYNKGDGIFIAPVTGVYAFHFSLCIAQGASYPWASLEVTVNGIGLGSTYEGVNTAPGGYPCTSGLVISDVNSGDHVFIRTFEETRGAINSAPNGRTSFSGWLISFPPTSPTTFVIAFYSYLSRSSGPITAHHTLVYDNIHINRENGYNKSDGIFIAPVSGVYVFHFSVCLAGSSYASFEILVNGEVIGAVNEESHAGMGYREGSNLVVTFANSGDHIFIRTQKSTMGYVFSNDICKTSFSGWFLSN
ncbi:uncharacterized protein LOC134259739 [Saccostrea cucullata]|uniref:uncharacterized protein LOC134259739 n=1 Tax=Saccostrea cuccullata TaxID=36930 RepID=UPI002ECFCACF